MNGICSNCGHSIEGRLNFCPGCGAARVVQKNSRWSNFWQFLLVLAAIGLGISGACFAGFGAFGFDNRDIGFPPSARMFSLGLGLLIVAVLCVYAARRLVRRNL